MKIAPLFLLFVSCVTTIISEEVNFQVSIYRRRIARAGYEHIAVGAIIHRKLVLTTANVLIRKYIDGIGIAKEDYLIYAGRPKETWMHDQPDQQESGVNEINIPHEYLEDENRIDYNIALIEVYRPFEETKTVRIMRIAREDYIKLGNIFDLYVWSRAKIPPEIVKIQVAIEECSAYYSDVALTREGFCICADGDSWYETGAGIVFNDRLVGIGSKKRFIQPRKHLQFIDACIEKIEGELNVDGGDKYKDEMKSNADFDENADSIPMIKCVLFSELYLQHHDIVDPPQVPLHQNEELYARL